MIGQYLLLLSLAGIYSHYNGVYQGYPGLGYDKKDERGVIYTDSVAQCIQYCRKYQGKYIHIEQRDQSCKEKTIVYATI